MSYLTHAILAFSLNCDDNDGSESLLALAVINDRISPLANGQRFNLMNTENVGGGKVWCYVNAAACFNYFSIRQIKEALDGVTQELDRCDELTLVAEDEECDWEVHKIT